MFTCVLAAAFSLDYSHVVLLQKKKGPACLIGSWNFAGGKVGDTNTYETPLTANVREFEEETGVLIPRKGWRKLVTFQGPSYRSGQEKVRIITYVANTNDVFKARTMTEEPVGIFRLDALPSPLPQNLPWMLSMATDQNLQSGLWKVRS